jgi:hypothetical protein
MRTFLLLSLIFALQSCTASDHEIRFSADFESGNLPMVTPLDEQGVSWQFALRDDNNNASLPNTFRTWWYFRVDNVPVQKTLHLEFTRLGFPYYFVPIYSYDQQTWQYFDDQDVTLLPGCNVSNPTTCRLIVTKQFTQATVWLARTFPYTTNDLSEFLISIESNPSVQSHSLGNSPHFQKPIQFITINDSTRAFPKQTVWLHARTHPAETGPSFILEGLIQAVLNEDALGRSLRQHFIFNIVPMHNIDGVILGNYRTNASSINLENTWFFTSGNQYLDSTAPLEDRLVNQNAMVGAMLNTDAPVALALNLHSSNSDPDTGAFFFPHFGSTPNYSAHEQNLWKKQLAFIKLLAKNFDGRIEQPPLEGGAGFLNSFYPETWWWANKTDTVNAMTLETTYGRAGFDHWVTEDNLRSLGGALAQSINEMNAPQAQSKESDMSMFRLPFKPEIYETEPE